MTNVIVMLRFLPCQVRAILDAGLSVILCIGESKAEYEAGAVKEVREKFKC